MRPSKKNPDADLIDALLESSWEQPPAQLLKRVQNIPTEFGVGLLPAPSIREVMTSFLVYGVIYTWLIGMFLIFKTTLLATMEKLLEVLSMILPAGNLPAVSPWIPLGLIFMLGFFLIMKFLIPDPLPRRR